MFDDAGNRAKEMLSTLSTFGKAAAIQQVQSMLIPHVLNIFAEHDHTVLRKMIYADYDLVREEMPPGLKQALQNIGSDPEFRQQYEGLVLQTLTPENILEWLDEPEEWLDPEEAAEQIAEIKRCADTIRETPGGQEWLERQVWDLYRLGNIVPEDSTPAAADD